MFLKEQKGSDFDTRKLCTRQFYIIKNTIKGSKRWENIDQKNFAMNPTKFLNSCENHISYKFLYNRVVFWIEKKNLKLHKSFTLDS